MLFDSFSHRAFGRVVICLLIAGASGFACAHPHAWIDVGTTFETDAKGQLVAVRQDWLYDDLLTDALLDEFKNGSKGKTLDVGAYTARTMRDLQPYGYFMQLKADGKVIAWKPVQQFHGGMDGKVVRVTFTAQLARPVDPRREAVVLKVFDPTYYIKMLQNPDAMPTVSGAAAAACSVRVVDADPTPRDYAKALALDSGNRAGPEFGGLFAQQVLAAVPARDWHWRCWASWVAA